MYILDRFEGDLAVFISKENGEITVPREVFGNCKEGDVFRLSEGGSLIYDPALTDERKESVKSRFTRLVKRK